MPANVQTLSGVAIELDAEPVPRRIGLIILSTDHTTERDFARLVDSDEVGVYVARIAFENPTSHESLLRTGPRLTEAAALILPGERLDVVAYSCTAASVILGDAAVAERIHAAKPEAACVTPAAAAIAAFATLGVRRVSLLTPYTPKVTDEMVTYFERQGLEVVNAHCLGFDDDRQMARITPASLVEAGVRAMADEAEALFVSCTGLRSAVVVDELERRIGRPVVTSNQASIWQSLRLAGIDHPVAGSGRLLRDH